MPINKNYICVYDFETSSADPLTTQPLEIGAIMLDPRTLEVVKDSQFHSLFRPTNMSEVQDGALKVNGLTREQIAAAPEQKLVFENFAQYVKKFGGGSQWNSPIRAGHNILGFDNVIMDRLCLLYGKCDKNGRQSLFHPTQNLDTLHICFMWFENLPEPNKLGMDCLRPFFGLSDEGAHSATADVENTAKILVKFMEFHRRLSPKTKFKNAFSNVASS